MTEVHVEQAPLDSGVALIYKDTGRRVRMAFDPRRTTEALALTLLRLLLPRLEGAIVVVRSAGTSIDR
ncbi:hypothetical protein I5Q34_30920 [Streptomyces sp. AV19]|uniref:hypothetical protein n=1 Tax=Streptomyces sp. AV19 TaxID=2793068 RepID=UPI0018FEB295|nr:hypothetical protein [Streptomyces sp. AV19]MBH1938621.1 hypothetical protein [Streptomyces sp. AV19]MDG4535265.1 hypothetical protein [Streptomyces sp. AV19]